MYDRILVPISNDGHSTNSEFCQRGNHTKNKERKDGVHQTVGSMFQKSEWPTLIRRTFFLSVDPGTKDSLFRWPLSCSCCVNPLRLHLSTAQVAEQRSCIQI